MACGWRMLPEKNPSTWTAVRLVLWWDDKSSALEKTIILVTLSQVWRCYCCSALEEKQMLRSIGRAWCPMDTAYSQRKGKIPITKLIHPMDASPRRGKGKTPRTWSRHFLTMKPSPSTKPTFYSYHHWPTSRPSTFVWSICYFGSYMILYSTTRYVITAATWYCCGEVQITDIISFFPAWEHKASKDFTPYVWIRIQSTVLLIQ